MKIIKLTDVYKVITLVPRVMPNDGDTIVIKLRDEQTNIESVINHNWNYQNNWFTIELGDPEVGVDFYQVYHKYEMTILRENHIIYKGKVDIIGEDDSIQDFKITPIPTNNKIKF